jgi:hypothetical protein
MFGLTRPTVTATMLQELLTFRSTQVHPWFWVEFVLLDLLCVIYCRSFFVFCPFDFCHCIVCPISIYAFSNYPFGISKHCCPSQIYTFQM